MIVGRSLVVSPLSMSESESESQTDRVHKNVKNMKWNKEGKTAKYVGKFKRWNYIVGEDYVNVKSTLPPPPTQIPDP